MAGLDPCARLSGCSGAPLCGRGTARGLETAEFDYELPSERIAQEPLARRDQAKLLVLHRQDGRVEHRHVFDLPELLRSGDLLVVNDTRVRPARMRARRASGGQLEFLLLRPDGGDRCWLALARPARRARSGEWLELVPPDGQALPPARIRVLDRLDAGEVRLEVPGDVAGLLPAYGEVPLPPYIRAPLRDPERYQTVYGRVEGSAAAPTAGLHFTQDLLARLETAGVRRAGLTLHVGLGTFRPLSSARIEDHTMHAEWFEVPPSTAAAVDDARRSGRRVIAVGTTVVRTLEASATGNGAVRAGSGWTDLYITPGRPFATVDALLTNFHLPRSTLLVLVSAFAGRERVLAAYREAVRLGYRFFSFGDAMLIV